MSIKVLDTLIIKYLNNTISNDELDELHLLLESKENDKIFTSYLKTNYAISYNMKKFNTDKSKKQLLEMIANERKVVKIRTFQSAAKYAAVLLILLASIYFYRQTTSSPQELLNIKESQITLTLSDGNVKLINPKEEQEIVDITGNVIGIQQGKTLNYAQTTPTKTLTYNELTVPYGKRFNLALSDGSRVSLNSGTTIKYPVQFIKGKDRKVFVTGEAYFDIEKDSLHPFIVNAQDLNIRVLGTHFNLSSFPEDKQTQVVLVEGSVGMYLKDEKFNSQTAVVLSPGHMGIFSKGNKSIDTRQVNTSIYTSWIDGNIVFRKETFTSIITKLERLYNVPIINNNEEIAHETFNANVNIEEESLEQVLDYFKKVYEIHYQIVNNKIVIK
ncbi:FecR family protein [Flavobacteriaceae bacterium F08102]|nr:FecR family protein [Flavobacteriaceae bacterium F08102]